MDRSIRKELIVKTTLEVLQSVLSTNIMDNLERLNEDEEESINNADDLDEERFIYEQLAKKMPAKLEPDEEINVEPDKKTEMEPVEVKTEAPDSSSLTYFEIVEQEMMQSLPITKENVELFQQILCGFDEFISIAATNFRLQTEAQLTNILFYALMSNETSSATEQTLFLQSGTVNKVLQKLCGFIAGKKHAFITWPNKREISKCVRQFKRYHEYGKYEFYNVFGAVGTLEMHIRPAIRNHLAVASNASSYTPVKWQCCSDASGLLQSSFVMIPKTDKESKNSYVFEVNPLNSILEAMKSDENYLVADETLTLCPNLLTPHEKLIIHAEQHNRALESKRKIIDKAFTLIQSRFPILERIELRDAESIRNLIDTVGVLHNFLIVHCDHLYLGE